MTLEEYRIFDSGLEDEDDEKDVIAKALAHERKYRELHMKSLLDQDKRLHANSTAKKHHSSYALS